MHVQPFDIGGTIDLVYIDREPPFNLSEEVPSPVTDDCYGGGIRITHFIGQGWVESYTRGMRSIHGGPRITTVRVRYAQRMLLVA